MNDSLALAQELADQTPETKPTPTEDRNAIPEGWIISEP